MTTLNAVHLGLQRVRRYRTAVRWAGALGAAGCIVLGALLAAFSLDVWIEMGRIERAVLLVALVALVVWLVRKFIVPAMRTEDDEVTLALLVEQHQKIDSDLVAALQFAESQHAQAGSGALRQAVVEYVDELAPSLNFMEGFTLGPVLKPIGLMAASVLVWVMVALVAPGHVRVFAGRLLLSTTAYPTLTHIVDIAQPGERVAYGQPLRFDILVDGVLPESGEVALRSLTGNAAATVALAHAADHPGRYTGQLDRLLDEVEYTLRIGDASVGPRKIELIPMPVVKLDVRIDTPEYARPFVGESLDAGDQKTALAGSNITLIVTAHKPLRSATLTLNGKDYALGADGDRFVLDGAAGPLANVTDTLQGEVQVVDEDGMSLDRPMNLRLAVRPDRAPRVAAAAVTRTVLPDASPKLRYQVVDDFGLAQIVMHLTITRSTPAPGSGSGSQQKSEAVVQEIASIDTHARNSQGTQTIDLKPLQLQKGDRVAVTLEAIDWRGPSQGEAGRSETLMLEVSDREGVLANMEELDDQLSRRMDEIIRAQLGIGGRP